ncbi:MAG TPA: DUF3820 family protein [Methylophilaceae bacterium]|jgi:hypothetical protein
MQPETPEPQQLQQADLVKLVTMPMPYGKYQGRMLADLPGHYLNWFAREGFPKGELGRLIALMQEIDHNGLSDLLKPLRTRQS